MPQALLDKLDQVDALGIEASQAQQAELEPQDRLDQLDLKVSVVNQVKQEFQENLDVMGLRDQEATVGQLVRKDQLVQLVQQASSVSLIPALP